MKQFFIAYRHTGEDLLELEKRIRTIETALAAKDIKAYATLFDEDTFVQNKATAGQIMKHAFEKMDSMDGLFVLIMNSEKSEGQLIEVGYTIAKDKPVIVARQKNAKTYVHELTDLSIEFDDLADLARKIQDLDL